MDVVQMDHVSKRYVLGERLNAREAVHAAARRLIGPRSSPGADIWALRDVSFSVSEGQALGIVGRNGAGKSTVLKLLAGITTPTAGVSRTRGRVAGLLEVGTGFHPELTGRENIYFNGAILGMSRSDITRRFDQIVDFSGIERFLDTPVKRYSSGMYLRLAFAVAAHLEPDVLVVDEILAVGDAEFQRKCLGRMQEAEGEGRTLIFVSHDLETLSKICPQSIWLESGSIRDAGATEAMVRGYLNSGLSGRDSASQVYESDAVTVHDIRVLSADGQEGSALMRGDQLRIETVFDVAEDIPGLDLALLVTSSGGVRVIDEVLSDRSSVRLSPGKYRVSLALPPMLNVGGYTAGLWFGTRFGTSYEDLFDLPAAAPFTLHGSDLKRPERVLVLNLPFAVERLDAAP
jgi:ABC-2 type transport system ATP-binding protein/lipopolysaccharide transport system ATP-binding protein